MLPGGGSTVQNYCFGMPDGDRGGIFYVVGVRAPTTERANAGKRPTKKSAEIRFANIAGLQLCKRHDSQVVYAGSVVKWQHGVVSLRHDNES